MGVNYLTMVTWHTYTERHHHKRNLRNGRESKHTLDVALGASYCGGIESGEHTHPYHDAHLAGSILNPQWEETRNLEHTGNNHRCGMDERADWSRAFHGVGQPDVEWEHC